MFFSAADPTEYPSKSMADDFSIAVKKALADRVGHLCSNSECRALTSGPQDDPARAINLGVAAHITAASPGGPRFDPDLRPEDRAASLNGIWVCQNCAKLIDNDVQRFSVEVLQQWKADAEADAKARVGKTALLPRASNHDLQIGARVRITPIIPREHEQSDFMLEQKSGHCFIFKKLDSQRQIEIPKSFVEKIHSFGGSKPALLELCGRLQWVSTKRNFETFPEKPPSGAAGAYGIGKNVDHRYPARLGITRCAFGREGRLPEILGQGKLVFYDSDGTYLKWDDQVLVVDWV
jgi:hypothetical protein